MVPNVISPEEIRRGVVDGILPVYKKWGETPLETLNRLREALPELKEATLSYAGRLDPLAEGVMLILVGPRANKDRKMYLSLDKTYEVEVLLGVSTDTGDLLGLHKDVKIPLAQHLPDEEFMKAKIKGMSGSHSFPYPMFSSRSIKGKTLFQWAKEGKIGEIEIPTTNVHIYNADVLEMKRVSVDDLVNKAVQSARSVAGDFRQDQIVTAWNEFLIKNLSRTFAVIKIRIDCSSGTYMRTLAEEIGKHFGVPGLAYSIKRTKVSNVTEEKTSNI